MEYGLIAGLVIVTVIVALYFNRRDTQNEVEVVEDTTTDTTDNISGMTKKELQEYALMKYNKTLPNSMKKQDMIDSIVNLSNEI